MATLSFQPLNTMRRSAAKCVKLSWICQFAGTSEKTDELSGLLFDAIRLCLFRAYDAGIGSASVDRMRMQELWASVHEPAAIVE
jgi:hypothetical protein